MTTGRQRWQAVVLALALAPLVCAAAGAPPATPAQERERIRLERDALERRFQAALTACGDRFAVTACTDAARAERRAAMERLSREQGVLDDAERKDRAAQRLRRIEDKMREVDQRRETAAPARAPAVPAAAASAGLAAPSRHITRGPAASQRASDTVEREAAARAAAAQRRASEAQAHREAVEKRNAERAARRPPAAGLPVPAASAP